MTTADLPTLTTATHRARAVTPRHPRRGRHTQPYAGPLAEWRRRQQLREIRKLRRLEGNSQ